MKRLYFVLLISCVGTTSAWAQVSNCTQVVRLARTIYEQGRLHELPTLMDGCLNLSVSADKRFTTPERKEALRYLTLAYIYLEEPE